MQVSAHPYTGTLVPVTVGHGADTREASFFVSDFS